MANKELSAKKAALQKACKEDLRFLCKEVMGMRDWEDKLHGELAEQLKKPSSRKLFLMPRGHLKSSIITVGWATQQLLVDPNLRILITNAVWDKARIFLGQISEYLTDQSVLPQLFGQFQDPTRKWTRDEIEIAQKKDGSKRGPSISTAGLEKSLAGTHYDLIIHDDLVDETNITTKEQVAKVKTFYRNSLPLLDPGGRIVVIGTRWIIGDLYQELIETTASSVNNHIIENAEDRMNWRNYVPTP